MGYIRSNEDYDRSRGIDPYKALREARLTVKHELWACRCEPKEFTFVRLPCGKCDPIGRKMARIAIASLLLWVIGMSAAIGMAWGRAIEQQKTTLQKDFPPPVVPLAEVADPPSAPAMHVMNAPAVKEKGAARGFCDYPGRVPCWCRGGQVDGYWLSECSSAEEYHDDVIRFGAPRNRVQVPLRTPEYLTYTVEDP